MPFFSLSPISDSVRWIVIGFITLSTALLSISTLQILCAFCPLLQPTFAWQPKCIGFVNCNARDGGKIVTAFGRNLPESLIISVLGPAPVKEGPIALPNKLWKEAALADTNLMYDLNNGDTVVFSIKNGTCFHADSYDYSEHLSYQDWKANCIGAFARGKTEEQIIAKFGKPTSRATGPVIWEQGMRGDEGWKIISTPTQLAADESWTYDTGRSTCEQLMMKNHRCTGADQLGIWH